MARRKRKNIRLIVSGYKDFNDYTFFKRTLYNYLASQNFGKIEILVAAGSKLRLMAQRFARECSLREHVFIANRSREGNLAEINRNIRMFNYATQETCVLFSFQKEGENDKTMVNAGIKYGVEIHTVDI